ncbi:MAG: hypothetical protein GX121_01530 [Ignavibacteria bacterium]|nr:hypothetical protein [Ignavibacteria bacterium]
MKNHKALKKILSEVKIYGDNQLIPIKEDLNLASFAFIDDYSFDKAAKFFTYLAEAIMNNCDFAFLDENMGEKNISSFCKATSKADLFVFIFLHKIKSNSLSNELITTFNQIIKPLSQNKPSVSLIFNNQIPADQIESNTILTFANDSLESIASSILFLSKEDPLEIIKYSEMTFKN